MLELRNYTGEHLRATNLTWQAGLHWLHLRQQASFSLELPALAGWRPPRTGAVYFEGRPLHTSPELRFEVGVLSLWEQPWQPSGPTIEQCWGVRSREAATGALLTRVGEAFGLPLAPKLREYDLPLPLRRALLLAFLLDLSPRVLLLDEPFSAWPARLWPELEALLQAREEKVTVVASTGTHGERGTLGTHWLAQGASWYAAPSGPLSSRLILRSATPAWWLAQLASWEELRELQFDPALGQLTILTRTPKVTTARLLEAIAAGNDPTLQFHWDSSSWTAALPFQPPPPELQELP